MRRQRQHSVLCVSTAQHSLLAFASQAERTGGQGSVGQGQRRGHERTAGLDALRRHARRRQRRRYARRRQRRTSQAQCRHCSTVSQVRVHLELLTGGLARWVKGGEFMVMMCSPGHFSDLSACVRPTHTASCDVSKQASKNVMTQALRKHE